MKETTKISLRNHAMSDQTKQDNTVSKSRSNGVLSVALEERLKGREQPKNCPDDVLIPENSIDT